MIKVVSGKDRMAVSGHAMFAPKGNDLVCAAVSGIVFGAASLFGKKNVLVDKEQAVVTINAAEDRPKTKIALEVVATQLETIAKSYPDHITFIKE